jgi:adenylate cyclase
MRCAVEVQRAMAERNAGVVPDKRIDFRIGVNLGDVIVEEHDIFGDGVNVAARLEALAEPGEICVSRVARDQVRDKVAFGFVDLGEQQVKNIARPVRVYRVRDEDRRQRTALVGLIPTIATPDKPSIAVLSFTNMSTDPEQEYFADGIAEDVITALSQYPSLFVIARNSSFTYKSRAVDVKQIGSGLGVRYVLEGSLRKAGKRIRVTAQLVEAETGKHVWAERYDRDLADIFAVQDEITEAVTTAIAPAIAHAEQRRAVRKSPGSLDAWASYQRGLWHLTKFSTDENAAAKQFFQQAIDLDPTFAGGYTGLASACYAAAALQSLNISAAVASMKELARQALALDTADATAHCWLGVALLMSGDTEGGFGEVERALETSPNLALAYGWLGTALIYTGRPKEGLQTVLRYVRLDPRDPMLPNFLHQLVVGKYFCRDYEAAVEAAKRVIRAYPELPLSYRWLAASLGQLGRTVEAKDALQRAIAVAPAWFQMLSRRRPPWVRPEDHAHILEGLRKAGWRET